jgi:hypothetical protein
MPGREQRELQANLSLRMMACGAAAEPRLSQDSGSAWPAALRPGMTREAVAMGAKDIPISSQLARGILCCQSN